MVTFDFGNKTVSIQVVGRSDWKGLRTYFDLEVSCKANPIRSLYEIHDGSTRDKTVSVGGRSFAYDYGFCDSKTKRRAVDEAVEQLLLEIAATGVS